MKLLWQLDPKVPCPRIHLFQQVIRGNAFGLSGTTITVTGNQISGIAPRLLNAATYSFEIQASIQGGTVTNNRTFYITYISLDSYMCIAYR